MKQLWLVGWIVFLAVAAQARLGETKEQTDRRFGVSQPYSSSIPTSLHEMFPEMENVCLYPGGNFDGVIGFSNGISIVEFHDKAVNTITEGDLRRILNENAGGSAWRSTWKIDRLQCYERTDGRVAALSDGIQQVIVFDGKLLNPLLQRTGRLEEIIRAKAATNSLSEILTLNSGAAYSNADLRAAAPATKSAPIVLPEILTLNSGDTYSNVHLLATTPATFTIRHSCGIGTFALTSLSSNLLAQFYYDPVKAGAYRAAQAQARQAAVAAQEAQADAAGSGEISSEQRAEIDANISTQFATAGSGYIQECRFHSTKFIVGGEVYFKSGDYDRRAFMTECTEQVHAVYRGGVSLEFYAPSSSGDWRHIGRGEWSIWSDKVAVKIFE